MITPKTITLHWQKFDRMTEAGEAFRDVSCIYVQTDSKGNVMRVGKAPKGLRRRYWGGTGYAVDAAMHASGNLVFVAPVAIEECEHVEAALIWNHRDQLIYNNQGKRCEPKTTVQVQHRGTPPTFSLVSQTAQSSTPAHHQVNNPLPHSASRHIKMMQYLEQEALKMKCKFGHDHSNYKVRVAVDNPGLPREERPFHCPKCYLTYLKNHRPEYWTSFDTIAKANEKGFQLACTKCFPGEASGN